MDLYAHPALYDALLPAGAHIPYYRDLARRQPGEALELARGTGQLAVPIARAGVSMVGMDISAAMLDRARGRAAGAQVSVEYVLGDMREFELGHRFTFVFIARNSMLHLSRTEDIFATLATVKRHLAPNGVLAFGSTSVEGVD